MRLASDLRFYLGESRHIFIVCPRCEEVCRLSDARVSYRGAYREDWLDRIQRQEERLDRAEERFEERRGEIKESAIRRGRLALRRIIRRALPGLSGQGLEMRDVKTILDPVRFVVFDGLERWGDRVRRVLFLAGAPRGRAEAAVQESLRRTIRSERFEWRTLPVDARGRVTDV